MTRGIREEEGDSNYFTIVREEISTLFFEGTRLYFYG